MPIIVPSASASGVLAWTWIDAGGTERDLTRATSPNLFVSRGARGLGSPPVELVTEKLPFAAGGLVRYTKTRPLEIDLPLYVGSDTFAGLIGAMDDLRDWFDTGSESSRTPGYLQITRPDDSVRQIACYYAGGLEGDLSEGGPTWAPVVVSLLAPDPYWTDPDDTEVVYDNTDLAFVEGAPPEQVLINPGQFDAYPVWTITGPASSIGINNATTGRGISLTANGGVTLGVGDSLTIDTRPASQRTALPVLDGDATSQFSKLTANSALWWLTPGENRFFIGVESIDTTTSVTLAYRPRYRGALR